MSEYWSKAQEVCSRVLRKYARKERGKYLLPKSMWESCLDVTVGVMKGEIPPHEAERKLIELLAKRGVTPHDARKIVELALKKR